MLYHVWSVFLPQCESNSSDVARSLFQDVDVISTRAVTSPAFRRISDTFWDQPTLRFFTFRDYEHRMQDPRTHERPPFNHSSTHFLHSVAHESKHNDADSMLKDCKTLHFVDRLVGLYQVLSDLLCSRIALAINLPFPFINAPPSKLTFFGPRLPNEYIF